MRRFVLAVLFLAGIILLISLSCTPPPPEESTGQNEQGTSATNDTTEAEGSSTSGTSGVTENGEKTPVETGEATGEGTSGQGEVEGADTQTTEGTAMTDTSEVPANIFGHYTTWPPESITPEEVALLNRIVVVFETTKGIIKVRLFPDAAPIHSANCVKLVQEGFYDGLKFHRVIADFMSQGGDPTGDGTGGPGYTLPAEIGLTHEAGSMAAARTPDQVNPERRSSGSQFYWVRDAQRCASLNGQYTVYGKIVEGQDINLALTINYTGQGPIPGAAIDSIIKAWIEMG
jgi:cyclophilin family peptidyl-prolyl cis-trans isomerase